MESEHKPKIPRYYLYGDQLDEVELDFVHIEPIRERSGKHDWTIRAHAHPDHVQLLLVESGGGTIRIEDQQYDILAPCLIVVPVAMVHEIQFTPDVDGIVMNVAQAFMTAVTTMDNRLAQNLGVRNVYPISGTGLNTDDVSVAFHSAYREYVWSAAGRRAAVMASFINIAVYVMRLRGEITASGAQPLDRDYEIICRYREVLERSFKEQKGLEYYAGQLGVSTQRLNLACRARCGKTSSEVLHERVIIEAKRFLIYTEMTVAEIGYDLGFDDPAYFSRFFSQRVGAPPGAYRDEHKNARNAVVGDGTEAKSPRFEREVPYHLQAS
ncbi:helix-turn-helix domain-containing protein [Mariluticola halotolerans]|uniref:helix-turn-helix domain-containing protein n=1 Tax=Mariluticola halotolerans TaxID=2909283 RepID=UPI0026E3C435|nr:helix-turn-helix domain-containing protein [Mariluticola halotolerans]UJQ94119.1 helix-turn-helix domain-containing protein [Mariluticola halotolerans]